MNPVTPLSNSEFAERVRQLASDAPEFIPTATYDPDGDCIEFIARPDSFYAERIDDLVTVYYSHETNEIIGSLIKGASKFCNSILKAFPGFRIEVQDGRVRLEHLFLAKLWTSRDNPNDVAVLRYRKLIAIAEQTKAETSLIPCEA